ncbi:hypothetical protein [Polaromonas sp.]|uniref:hypothetical protein n=1 Tax=Polaromonas sp. TaxID=1869339 RepID=UPI0032644A1B
MPLLGQAAMLLSFDVVAEAIREHDDWHTHEHLRERLSIPGFVRGTRWVALAGSPRYCVVYEVEQLSTLTSAAYLERLNNPSPWTTQIMPHYRGMSRGFCTVAGSFGVGLGNASLWVRFTPSPGSEPSLRARLLEEVLPQLPSKPGLGSAHLFEAAATPGMTKEQSIRGADAPVAWVVLVIGYSQDALAELAQQALGAAQMEQWGATGVSSALYRLDYSLSAHDVAA